ncbi:MAG: mechanosensitive ion channel domain-containing protein [Halanaeroarchaeum sp.]
MPAWSAAIDPELRYVAAAVVFVLGLVLASLLGRLNVRLLQSLGVEDAVEGTTVERTARKFGTSTVDVLGSATAWLVFIFMTLLALEVAGYFKTVVFLMQAGNVLPNLLLALVILVLGLLAGDKAEVLVSEATRGIKVPEIGIVPTAVRYSVVLVAILLTLAQLGINVEVLILLFGAYVFFVLVVLIVSTRHLLTSAAAGIYLLLNQPYSIGDRIAIGEREGIVQEVDVFVTRIEDDGREYIVPNHLVLRNGAVLIRE